MRGGGNTEPWQGARYYLKKIYSAYAKTHSAKKSATSKATAPPGTPPAFEIAAALVSGTCTRRTCRRTTPLSSEQPPQHTSWREMYVAITKLLLEGAQKLLNIHPHKCPHVVEYPGIYCQFRAGQKGYTSSFPL